MAAPGDVGSLATETPIMSSTTGNTVEHEAIARGGVATPFPWKLHEMLDDSSKEHNEEIVGWCPHGRSFIVHKPKIFVEKIMPTYFNQSKFASFQRQLNLYGFHRITAGKDKGAYYHGCFVRGQVALCKGMVRQKIKGTKVRRTLAPGEEPDFYKMTDPSSDPTAMFKICDEGVSDPVVDMEGATEEQEGRTAPATGFAREEVLAAKERAHKIRRERLSAVQDALKQTQMFCREDEAEFDESIPSISIKPSVPSVSPLESEVSDSDDESSIFSPERLLKKIPPMPPLMNPPMLAAKFDAFVQVPRFHEMTEEETKGGDVLFFEGKPFRYLEHLDSLPPPAAAAQKPKHIVPANFATYPRDSLQSLMRVDPQALMGATAFNFRQTP